MIGVFSARESGCTQATANVACMMHTERMAVCLFTGIIAPFRLA